MIDESQAIWKGADNLDSTLLKDKNSGLDSIKIKYNAYSFELYKKAT